MWCPRVTLGDGRRLTDRPARPGWEHGCPPGPSGGPVRACAGRLLAGTGVAENEGEGRRFTGRRGVLDRVGGWWRGWQMTTRRVVLQRVAMLLALVGAIPAARADTAREAAPVEIKLRPLRIEPES